MADDTKTPEAKPSEDEGDAHGGTLAKFFKEVEDDADGDEPED